MKAIDSTYYIQICLHVTDFTQNHCFLVDLKTGVIMKNKLQCVSHKLLATLLLTIKEQCT